MGSNVGRGEMTRSRKNGLEGFKGLEDIVGGVNSRMEARTWFAWTRGWRGRVACCRHCHIGMSYFSILILRLRIMDGETSILIFGLNGVLDQDFWRSGMGLDSGDAVRGGMCDGPDGGVALDTCFYLYFPRYGDVILKLERRVEEVYIDSILIVFLFQSASFSFIISSQPALFTSSPNFQSKPQSCSAPTTTITIATTTKACPIISKATRMVPIPMITTTP